jgi:hypothetical protein
MHRVALGHSVKMATFAVHRILLAMAALLVACVSATEDRAPGPFYFNTWGPGLTTWNTESALSPQVLPYSSTHLLTTWIGAYPCIGCGSDPKQWCNGGIPQLANITLHQELITRDLDLIKVPAEYDGIFIVDYEAWHLGWNFTSKVYHNASIEYTKGKHPQLEGDALLQKAISEYEDAAMEFFIATVEAVKAARSNGTGYGFYGYPDIYTYWGSLDAARILNNRLMPLWNVTTAFAPSLYLPYKSGVDIVFARNEEYVMSNLKEAARVRTGLLSWNLNATRPRITPFAWNRYHPGEPHALQLLSTEDGCLEYAYPFLNGEAAVDGIIMWGDEATKEDANATKNWLLAHRGFLGAEPLPTPLNCTTYATAGMPFANRIVEQATTPFDFSRSLQRSLKDFPPFQRCSL